MQVYKSTPMTYKAIGKVRQWVYNIITVRGTENPEIKNERGNYYDKHKSTGNRTGNQQLAGMG